MDEEEQMLSRFPVEFAVLGLAIAFSQPASAQLAVGPVPYQETVDGVPVTVNVLSVITVQAMQDNVAVTAKVDADLFDLQQKIGAIGDTFNWPNNNCANSGANDTPNLVVSVTSKSLTVQGDQAMLVFGGQVDAWTCVKKAKSEVQWEMKKVGPIKTKVPVTHTLTNYVKTKFTSEPFEASMPVSFVKKDDKSVAVQLGQPIVRPEGQYVAVTNGILKIADVDVTQKVAQAWQSALDPDKLKVTIPSELERLNMTVQSADFKDDGGHVVAEVVLTSNVPWGDVANALKQIQSPADSH
jgi:hypothetical protein